MSDKTFPLISIISPCFNRVSFIGEMLGSVCRQGYPSWEMIIVDDGSDHASREQLLAITDCDPRIRYLDRKRAPKGANTCRNIGIEQARGDYLLFLDSDDLLAPHCLEQRVAAMRRYPDCAYLVFQIEKFQNKPGDTGLVWNTATDGDNLARFLRQDSLWHTSGPIWKKEAVRSLGGFDERLACWQDLDLHIRALAAVLPYRLCFNQPADCYYRLHESGTVSQQGFKGRDKLESLVKVVSACAGLSGCQATPERRNALSTLARRVAFKELECRQFDLHRQVVDIAKRHELFSFEVRHRMLLLKLFFGMGGYSIKGTHRLRESFQKWLDL